MLLANIDSGWEIVGGANRGSGCVLGSSRSMLIELDSLARGALARLGVSTSAKPLGVRSTLIVDPISRGAACDSLRVGVQKPRMVAGAVYKGVEIAGIGNVPPTGEVCTIDLGLDCVAADISISSEDLLPPMTWGPAVAVSSKKSIARARRRGWGFGTMVFFVIGG